MKRILRESSARFNISAYLNSLPAGEKGSYADFCKEYPNTPIAPSTYQMTRAAILRDNRATAPKATDAQPTAPKKYDLQQVTDMMFELENRGWFDSCITDLQTGFIDERAVERKVETIIASQPGYKAHPGKTLDTAWWQRFAESYGFDFTNYNDSWEAGSNIGFGLISALQKGFAVRSGRNNRQFQYWVPSRKYINERLVDNFNSGRKYRIKHADWVSAFGGFLEILLTSGPGASGTKADPTKQVFVVQQWDQGNYPTDITVEPMTYRQVLLKNERDYNSGNSNRSHWLAFVRRGDAENYKDALQTLIDLDSKGASKFSSPEYQAVEQCERESLIQG